MIKIESVRNLLDALESEVPEAQMFRGQTRDWPLLPGIGRYPDTVVDYDNWIIFHDHIISRFLRYGHPFFSEYPKKGAETWALAQHHGLPTRLLDTTTNPLKALFFAVNNPAEDANDGVLWAFSYRSWREELDEEHASGWTMELTPFLPHQGLGARLIAQEGCFISYPLPANQIRLKRVDELKQDNLILVKFFIPAAKKGILRQELAILGVQYRLLFPDLDGIARNIRLTELGS